MIVYLESNLFPALKVYDSSSPPSHLTSWIKLGAKVESDNGTVIYQTPNPPTVAPAIQWSIFLGLLGLFMYGAWRVVR